MKLTVLAASALIAFSTVTALNAQTARDFAQPGVRAGLETEIDQSMCKMLGQAKERLIADRRAEIILPFICPHAMRVLAGIAAGKVDMGTGARLFLFGLDMDRNEMMGMKVGRLSRRRSDRG